MLDQNLKQELQGVFHSLHHTITFTVFDSSHAKQNELIELLNICLINSVYRSKSTFTDIVLLLTKHLSRIFLDDGSIRFGHHKQILKY